MSPRVHQNYATCTCAELSDTAIRKVVAPTPEQLHEYRLGIPQRMDADDRELLSIQQVSP